MSRYRWIRSSWSIVLIVLISGCSGSRPEAAMQADPWHGIERTIRYQPDKGDFVITNGELRFNRALYGTHTGFRVEAGDLPEFALYLPGVGGNFKLGVLAPDTSLWLIDAEQIEARYRPGSMIYEIRDPLFGRGSLRLTLLARSDAEGMILRCETRRMPRGVKLCWAYGGASGKRFSRSGDLGADPESVFYLQPEYCLGNEFDVDSNHFTLRFRSVRNGEQMEMKGVVPPGSATRVCDAEAQETPSRLIASGTPGTEGASGSAEPSGAPGGSGPSDTPVIAGALPLSKAASFYFMVSRGNGEAPVPYREIPALFDSAEHARQVLAGRIRVDTPDPWVNNLAGALAVAADAIWEDPSYLHGAVAWRMHLPGWRGAYAGDWLGWHDRAQTHFEAYARSQYVSPPEGPNAPDPATHLARQVEKKGNSLFTEGYISRNPGRISDPHHYDMNLVFIDQLQWHLQWTGDTVFAREMWPLLTRHLAWEKRCFDANDDGLYDAYAAIWASDALQYSGGGVTHSSAYNFRGNLMAARIAEMLGEDPTAYLTEAEKIHRAVNDQLWIPEKGWYGEFRDLLGLQRVHPYPAVWTIYHAIDEGISDPFRSWQSLRYIDRYIPHIPLKAEGMPPGEFHILSNSNWMPYTWSINNVAMAENMNVALAFWQAGRSDEAFTLWKSQLLESMYLGSSPGNFQQLSFYDAFRGELYRDFADPVGVTARTLVEGLFGVIPDALEGVLTIRPGFPESWEYATLETPDILVDYKREGNRELYVIRPSLPVPMDLRVELRARSTSLRAVTLNGKKCPWVPVLEAVGSPMVRIETGPGGEVDLLLEWEGTLPDEANAPDRITEREQLQMGLPGAVITGIHDPQQVLSDPGTEGGEFRSDLTPGTGDRSFFLEVEQGAMTWWMPIEVEIRPRIEIQVEDPSGKGSLGVRIRNNTDQPVTGDLYVNYSQTPVLQEIGIAPGSVSEVLEIPLTSLAPGSNHLEFAAGRERGQIMATDWQIPAGPEIRFTTVDLGGFFNDRVTRIFQNRYLSPRSPYPTLQLPWQGIGDWASYAKTAEIDDTGIRERAGSEGRLLLSEGIPVATLGDTGGNNIVFTSLWDNYPDQVTVPLSGRASHAYLLMAGSTHHMQSRIANGTVAVDYTDGSSDNLDLVNPETWWPIEQDYYRDRYAFSVPGVKPPRIHLKDGSEPVTDYEVLARNRTNLIDGGAALLLDLPLDPAKELESLTVKTLSNDVVVGLMSLTLIDAE